MSANPLYRNDKPGVHAPSWYAASLREAPLRARLEGLVTADVVVLGAGYTGLWAALTLARAGRRVVVLDAHRVGFGASGRNGGQVHVGFNQSQRTLEARLGDDAARRLWDLAETGRKAVIGFCETDAPEAAYRPGMAHGVYSASELAEERAEAEHLSTAYDHPVEVLDAEAFRAEVKSPLYQGGSLDPQGGHLHPLAYAQALARAFEAAGGIIFERSEVKAIREGPRVRFETATGTVEADHGIVAGNGYLPSLVPKIAARVLPINSFIAATEPLPETWRDVLAEDIAVSDSKFVVNYYRFSADRRFLFGGRESYGLGFPQDINTALIARMTRLFPQLEGVRIDHVWGGTLGITPTRLPFVGRVGSRLLTGSGFSGHGVAMTAAAGRVMAEAVMGQEDGLTTFEALPVPRFSGGHRLRAPILTLAMTWFALRDRLGI